MAKSQIPRQCFLNKPRNYEKKCGWSINGTTVTCCGKTEVMQCLHHRCDHQLLRCALSSAWGAERSLGSSAPDWGQGQGNWENIWARRHHWILPCFQPQYVEQWSHFHILAWRDAEQIASLSESRGGIAHPTQLQIWVWSPPTSEPLASWKAVFKTKNKPKNPHKPLNDSVE